MQYENYRMDHRTEEEFIKDIASNTVIEKDIIQRYARFVKRVYGIDITIADNGCDNSGEFLAEGQVSTAADFLINDQPVEVKHFKASLGEFPLKSAQLESYLKQGARIILVNGYTSAQPQFTLIQVSQIKEIIETHEEVPYVPWGGKLVYMVSKSDFKWFNLDK